MASRIEIFCCYAREDKDLLDKLRSHLKPFERGGSISVWHDSNITPGTDWETEIDRHLDDAQIVLLLVSPDFLASDYCYSKEMMRAMERHTRGETRVIPVILRPTHWQKTPFGKLQALSTGAKPIRSIYWNHIDDALFNVVESLSLLIDEISSPSTEEAAETEQNNTIDQIFSLRDETISTGLNDLDRLLRGLQDSDLIAVVAPPSTGLTSFALHVTSNIALKQKHSVCYFSLGMKKDRLIQRLIAMDANIDYVNMVTGAVKDDEWEYIVYTMDQLSEADIRISDAPGIDLADLQSQIQEEVNEHKTNLIIIDNFDFINTPIRQQQTQYDRDRETIISLKMLARKIDIPIMLLIRKPLINDSPNTYREKLLKTSKDPIVSYVDIIIHLYRDDLYFAYSERINLMDIIVTKNSSGFIGELSVYFNAKSISLRNLVTAPPENENFNY